jgi:hypothetical protein
MRPWVNAMGNNFTGKPSATAFASLHATTGPHIKGIIHHLHFVKYCSNDQHYTLTHLSSFDKMREESIR